MRRRALIALIGAAWSVACGAATGLDGYDEPAPTVNEQPDAAVSPASPVSPGAPQPHDAGESHHVVDAAVVEAGPSCDAGTVLLGDACTPVSPSVLAPRAIAPLSTATVTSQTPTLRWQAAPGTDGARVEICSDYACGTSVQSFTASGTSATPPTPLTRGVYHWRLRGMAQGVVGAEPSPSWEIYVGARSAAVDTSWNTTLEVNGDGVADLVVGAPGVDGTGAAYFYYGSPVAFPGTPATLTGATVDGSSFGSTLAAAGDVNGDGFGDVIVGAPGSGTAYVFFGGSGGIATTNATFSMPNVRFATAVAGAGDVNGDGYGDVIVGAVGDGAYLYLGSANGPATTPITLFEPAEASSFAQSVSAGDFNGDGYSDILVGAPFQGGGELFLYLGGPNGIAPTDLPLTINGPTSVYSEYFGDSVSNAGDVNGDGYADVLVGAPNLYNYGSGPGYLYLGGKNGLAPNPALLPDGFAVAAAGDIDGDGFGDVVVGTPDGRADILLGGIDGLATKSTPLTLPTAPPSSFGLCVAGGGDLNADGFADVVVGAPSSGTAGAYIFYGAVGAPTLPTQPGATLMGIAPDALFGSAAAL